MSYSQPMHSLTLLTFGSAQESWQNEAQNQYLSRIKPFAHVQCVELPDQAQSPTVNPDMVRAREADILLKRLPAHGFVIALDERGKNLSSSEWAELLTQEAERGTPITLVMGGANGLDERIRARAHKVASLGKQTMPHILARIVLLEQLYRAETILRGKIYHR